MGWLCNHSGAGSCLRGWSPGCLGWGCVSGRKSLGNLFLHVLSLNRPCPTLIPFALLSPLPGAVLFLLCLPQPSGPMRPGSSGAAAVRASAHPTCTWLFPLVTHGAACTCLRWRLSWSRVSRPAISLQGMSSVTFIFPPLCSCFPWPGLQW